MSPEMFIASAPGLEELNQIPTLDLFCKILLRNVSFSSLGVYFINIYEQLLLVQIPKTQIDTDDLTLFLRFWNLCM